MTKVGPRDSLVRPLVYRRSGKLSISLRHLYGLADLVSGSYYCDSNPDLAAMLLGMGTMSNATLSRTDPNHVFYCEGWHIQHNIAGSSETRTHVVTWSDSSTTSLNKDVDGWGSGTGSGFLSALVPGDRIAVIARAKVRKILACFCCASITNLLWR